VLGVSKFGWLALGLNAPDRYGFDRRGLRMRDAHRAGMSMGGPASGLTDRRVQRAQLHRGLSRNAVALRVLNFGDQDDRRRQTGPRARTPVRRRGDGRGT